MGLKKEWDTEQWKLKTLITELPTNSIDQQHRKEALSSRTQGEVPSEGTLSVEFPLEIHARVILPKHKVSTNSGKGFTHMEGTELKPGKKGFEID
jgi:hypothetical protein